MSEPRAGTAWYLYGLISTQPQTQRLAGLDHVRCLPFRQAAALVGEVSLEEFAEERLSERMSDPLWLERKLWDHQHVLEQALEIATVIPMKFGVIFKSQEGLVTALEERADGITGLFKKLKGKHEYGLKVSWDRQGLSAQVEQAHANLRALKEQLTGQPEGTTYLLRKKYEKLLGEEVERTLGQDLHTIYERVGRVGVERHLNRVTAQQALKRQAEVVLNAVLLVAVDRREELLTTVGRLREELGPRGYSFQLVGPFPAYNFSQLPELSE